MREYRPTTVLRVKALPRTLGTQLARAALRKKLSVIQIAKATGATRATVYNWYFGKGVTAYYRPRVEQLITIISAAPTTAAAWSAVCSSFNLKA